MTSSEFAEALIQAASLHVGEGEDQPNRSAFIDACNRYTLAPEGSPYCLSAILYLADQVAKEGDLKLSAAVHPNCVRFFFYNHALGLDISAPEAGSIMIWQHIDKPAQGHAGLIEGLLDNGMIKTIEFNTSSLGSGVNREGDGCFRKVRSPHGTQKMRVLGYVRLV